MAITCGFFDSVNKDRLYRADEMTRPYELLVSNGVFATPLGTPSDYLQVYADSGMQVGVRTGRGIFKDKWFINDSDLPLLIEPAEVSMTRIDSIVARVDTSQNVREGTIAIKKGIPSTNPEAPVMERSTDVFEYRLANITVKPLASQIEQSDISDQRGSADCPWVTSLVQQVDTSTLFAQWEDAYEKYYAKVTSEYDQFYGDNKARFDAYYNEVLSTFDDYYSSLESKYDEYYNQQVSRFDNQYATNQSEFDALFAEMKATVGSIAVSVKSGYYTTAEDNETKVTVTVPYNSLVVYINGFHAVLGVDYTLSSSAITLIKPVRKGTVVSYVGFSQGSE